MWTQHKLFDFHDPVTLLHLVPIAISQHQEQTPVYTVSNSIVSCYIKVSFRLGWNAVCLRFSPFFVIFFKADFVDFQHVNSALVYYLRSHKYHFSATFSLKMGPTVLFTHLKIILLLCFQFSVFSCIQTDPKWVINFSHKVFNIKASRP